MWLTKTIGALFLCCHRGRGIVIFFTEELYLSELSGFSMPLVATFPSLPYFFPGSIPFPDIFPTVPHNQTIQTKAHSVSTLRYAFHAAEDVTGADAQQSGSVPVRSNRIQVRPFARFSRPWAQAAGLWSVHPAWTPGCTCSFHKPRVRFFPGILCPRSGLWLK